MSESLYQITAPHMCCGFVTHNGIVNRSADIVRWMLGKQIGFISTYCAKKHWFLMKVN